MVRQSGVLDHQVLARSSQRSNEELNLTGVLRWRLARDARESHLIGHAGRLTPAR